MSRSAAIPEHLSDSEAQGVRAGRRIAQFEIGDMRNFVYLVIDWPTRKTFVVDPQTDLEPWTSALEKNSLELEGILLTHSHFDHVGGLPGLLRRKPNLPVYVGPEDLFRLKGKLPESAKIRELSDDAEIELGAATKIRALHTPGHSPGEFCFFLAPRSGDEDEPPYLLTGDTVFIRDCGRTDLGGGSATELFRSLQRIKTLPPETVILPGHHYQKETASTLERELRESPPFRCRTAEELEALP